MTTRIKRNIILEGSKCALCKKGKVVYNKNPNMIPNKLNILCTNPDCEKYNVCKACGKVFGTHK